MAEPAFPTAVWQFKTTREGLVPVASGRGGPFNLFYEIHGSGDIKLVFIMGLGAIRSAWQRQLLYFGHDRGDKYSCLVFDLRGMGRSDKPLMRYSTSEMARDLIELLEYVGWTEERQIHVFGVSMGGMVAQELAMLIPNRISSLSLISTAAHIESTLTFVQTLRSRINMFIPKPLDRAVTDASRSLFPDSWLDKPDDCILPTASTPSIILPSSPSFIPTPASLSPSLPTTPPTPRKAAPPIPSTYLHFPTNFHRFAAQEITKRLDAEQFTRKGFMLQAGAAGFHYKSAAQLKEMGDRVGRNRIVVMHGTRDDTIHFQNGEVLMRGLDGGAADDGDVAEGGLKAREGAGGNTITKYVKEGSGHVLSIELTGWFNGVVEATVGKCEAMGKE